MTRIGIDYSLNSPSVTIDDNGLLVFISFFNTDGSEWDRKNPLKKFVMHNALSQVVGMRPYTRLKRKDWSYSDEQSAKMHDAKMISDMILLELRPYLEKDDCLISLEGFAFQSSGASFIDLILFNSFLRKDIIEKLGPDKLEIIAPKTAKKLAGKGNADKDYMIRAFINNVLDDKDLEQTELYAWLQENDIDYKNVKPLDDIVDSYFIMKSQTK